MAALDDLISLCEKPPKLSRKQLEARIGLLAKGRRLSQRHVPVDRQSEDLQRHVGGAEEGDRRPLHVRLGRQVRRPVDRLRGRRRDQAEGGAEREIYSITAQQTEEWKQSAQFLYKQWANDVRKAGGDPDAIMKELQTALVQFNAGF